MEKIKPKFLTTISTGRFVDTYEPTFSHKVLWYRFSVKDNLDPFSVFSKDDFIYDLIHNKAFFIFDHSNDPLSQDHFTVIAKAFLDIFKQYNINTNRIIVLTPSPSPFFYQNQDIVNYVSSYKSIPTEKKFHHIHHTYLWDDLQYDYLTKIKRGRGNPRQILKPNYNKQPRKHFLCLSRRDSVSRRFINYSLHKNNLFDKGIVSHQRVFEKSLFTSIDQFKLEVKQYSTRYDFDIDLFFKCGHAKHNLDEPLSKSSSAYSLQFHQDLSLQTCFELVTETDVFNSLFITEKTFKPILNKSPFLISGSPYTLAYLRKLGFETFDKLFDESYDSEIVYYDRVSILMDNMKRATKFNLLECYKNTTMYKDICEHNFNHFLSTRWDFNFLKNIQNRIDKVCNV